jgi:hypothetical protein
MILFKSEPRKLLPIVAFASRATGLRALMIQVYDLHLSALTASQSFQLNAGR